MVETGDGVLFYDLREYLRERGWRLVRVEWRGGELVAIVEERDAIIS